MTVTVQHDIVQFEITIDYPSSVQIPQPQDDLTTVEPRVRRGQGT